MRFLEKLGRDLRAGENLEVYLTIVVVFALLALDIFNVVSSEAVAAGTLATLALLAYSTLNTREQMERSIRRTGALAAAIETNLLGEGRAEDFLTSERVSHHKEFEQAEKIGIVGVTLTRTVTDYLSIFQQRLQAGATIDLVIIDPKGDAIEHAALRSFAVAGGEFYADRIKPTIDLVNVLSSISNVEGSLSLSFLPFAPSFGLTLIDAEKPGGIIYVEIYHHRKATPQPVFKLKRERDSYWYDFFEDQFRILLGCARKAAATDGFARREAGASGEAP